MGYSLGGGVALHLAAKYPAKVRRLVVVRRQEPRRDDRDQRLNLEVGPIEVDELPASERGVRGFGSSRA